MDLVVSPRIADRPAEGIAIYDNENPGYPVLVIENEHDIANLNRQLFAWLEWSRVAKNVVEIDNES